MNTQTNLPADPDGMNDSRADWALAAMRAFQQETGTDDDDIISDLVADILHLCDRQPHFAGNGTALDMIARGDRAYADEIETVPVTHITVAM